MSNWLSTRYENVFAYVEAGIRAGALAPGSRLPGERKLAEKLGISRDTVRQGLYLAEQSGLIVRVPQRGTFVAPPKVNQDLGTMRTFRQTVRGLSMAPAYQLNRKEEITLDAATAARLKVDEGSDASVIEVIGLADGLPMALYRSTLPRWVVESMGPNPTWGERASYELAGEAVGATTLDVTQEFEAVTLRRDLAQTLRTRSGTPGFMSISVFSVPGGAPLELRTAWYPGSRYRFSASRKIEIQGS
jgi:DNA-binding GntR family transcriptional regulator